jgi:hypothetical protein
MALDPARARQVWQAQQVVSYWCGVLTEPIVRRLTVMWWALLDRPIISRVAGSVTVIVNVSDEIDKKLLSYDTDVEVIILEEGGHDIVAQRHLRS